ncbi:MAG: M1 family aminopeptidase [Thermoanaerobaculia bacterium]|nr:M1 family aminopeptidase [Thermoanaerobaculia bacterium]
MSKRVCLGLLALLLVGTPVFAEGLADYALLREWRYATTTQPVPAGGLRFGYDTATFHLESGQLRFAEPTAAGVVTGLVFEGRGSFSMTVPDPLEREQLGRFTKGAVLENVTFTRLVLRARGGVPELVGLASTATAFGPQPLARERHEHWLEDRWFDVDARVVGAGRIPGDNYLRVEFESDEWGWLTYEVDALNPEEIQLLHREDGRTEVWLSLDLPADRDLNGRPTLVQHDHLTLEHVDFTIDLQKAGRESRTGRAEIQPRQGQFVADLRFRAKQAGAQALFLDLASDAKVLAVRRNGVDLPFVRDHIGARKADLDNRLYDASLLVFLPAPLVDGEEVRLVVEYETEIANYVAGRHWYPGESGGRYEDRHTGRFTITVPEKIELRAMGEKLGEERVAPAARRETWEMKAPSGMLTFAFAERAIEETVLQTGVPPVTAFGLRGGASAKNEVFNVAADVANAAAFFTRLFGTPIDAEKLTVTSIVSGHGQAFRGFLHLAESTFFAAAGGAAERFRAHETAHQWWGHQVAPASYRDDWLVESFAEYSALRFVEATLPDGPKLVHEALTNYRDELTGSIGSAMSRFGRGNIELNDADRANIGPIALGYRASTAKAPSGGRAVLYQKGPYVLHMLRKILARQTKSDELFDKILRDFVAQHQDRPATTEAFVATVNRHAPADLGWFFRQWVYGTGIPTYAWKYEIDGSTLVLSVRQTGVPAGFSMPVPIELELEGGKKGLVGVTVSKAEETFRLPLPGKPKKVVFNPENAVLAKVEKW